MKAADQSSQINGIHVESQYPSCSMFAKACGETRFTRFWADQIRVSISILAYLQTGMANGVFTTAVTYYVMDQVG